MTVTISVLRREPRRMIRILMVLLMRMRSVMLVPVIKMTMTTT